MSRRERVLWQCSRVPMSSTSSTTDFEKGERLVDLNALAGTSSKLHPYPYHEPPRCTGYDHYFDRNPNICNGEDAERWRECLHAELAEKGSELEQGSCGPVQSDAAESKVGSFAARL